MGLFHTISHWIKTRNQKRIAHAKSQGTCPECQGKGYSIMGNEYFVMHSYYDCHGRNGSGTFSDWVETNHY